MIGSRESLSSSRLRLLAEPDPRSLSLIDLPVSNNVRRPAFLLKEKEKKHYNDAVKTNKREKKLTLASELFSISRLGLRLTKSFQIRLNPNCHRNRQQQEFSDYEPMRSPNR